MANKKYFNNGTDWGYEEALELHQDWVDGSDDEEETIDLLMHEYEMSREDAEDVCSGLQRIKMEQMEELGELDEEDAIEKIMSRYVVNEEKAKKMYEDFMQKMNQSN